MLIESLSFWALEKEREKKAERIKLMLFIDNWFVVDLNWYQIEHHNILKI